MQGIAQENLQNVILFKKKSVVLPSAADKAGSMTREKRRRAGSRRGLGRERAGDGERRYGRRSGATVWATDFPVSVTEISVSVTVKAQPLPLPRGSEGDFRPRSEGFSEDLTKEGKSEQKWTVCCQNPPRHACVISDRGGAWWIWRAFSRLTNVKRCIAHCISGGTRRPQAAPHVWA